MAEVNQPFNPKNPTVEAAKEVGRYLVFVVVSVIINAIIGFLASLTTIGPIPAEVQTAIVGGITALLRYIDKYIHENENIDSKGIAPF